MSLYPTPMGFAETATLSNNHESATSLATEVQTEVPSEITHTPDFPSLDSTDPSDAVSRIETNVRLDASQKPLPWIGSLSADRPSNTSTENNKASTSKRRLDDVEGESPQQKIRRVARENGSQDPNRVMPMTTVICLHAAVAQKSYGSEKRFLCPPPVVHVEGPVWHMRSQQLSMVVVSETGERSFEQKASLDSNMTASFKFLHVGGTAKAKSFQLSLDISEPPHQSGSTEEPSPLSGRIWASFDSAPVSIISKPSKKTAKTRNISSCILAGGPVSLFNRINSQTVRTKYMMIDNTQLCASNISWSAFNVNVIRRPNDPVPVGGPQPVTYGCEIVLSDTQSGTTTPPLIIRKVDKGRITNDDGGPVSQMQKIALQRVNLDGTRHYLSAAGPMTGAPGTNQPNAAQSGTHPLHFQTARVREDVENGVRRLSDEVDDYLCWTIVGISKFQYTFFDALSQSSEIPEMPITPFPTLYTAPIYRPGNNTIELTVSNFFYEHPTERVSKPLDVYLGNIGPLPHRIYQAGPPGPPTAIPSAPYGQGLLQDENGASHDPSLVARYMAPAPLHTIVVVEMPTLTDVIKALEQDAIPAKANSPSASGLNEGDTATTNPEADAEVTPAPSIAGRSLPLLFIRPYDGVGYHSGRTIACENVFQAMDLGAITRGDPNWLAATQPPPGVDQGLHGWTLRVM